MLTATRGYCAACHGEIVDDINTKVVGATTVELCAACMDLGDPDTPKGLQRMLALVAERANPDAPIDETEARIEEWLELRAKELA
jgi:hypothetical protein